MGETPPVNIPFLDATAGDISQPLNRLRAALSPRGDIVSPAGRELTQKVFGEPLSPQQVITRICEDVRRDGDVAALRYSQQLDRFDRQHFRVDPADLAASHTRCDRELLEVFRRIRQRIERFQSAILHRDVRVQPEAGVQLTQRYTPLDRIGICVPGGAASYPSSLLMTAVPAQAAGVPSIAVMAPPSPLGAYNPMLQALCHELGIDELYAIGGAQGIAALAYGTGQVPAVDKIVGPGNLFVALAKQYVYGEVDIDSIAGPSEVIVVADQSTPPDWAAADLLSQAEHSPGSAVLVAWDRDVIAAIDRQLQRMVLTIDRSELTLTSLADYGAYILVRSPEQAIEVINQMAPEHLHLAFDGAREMVPAIRHAGATFVGLHAPVATGDYAAGPSHVLPTGGTARWASGLSSNHFLRSSSVIELDAAGLAGLSADVAAMATVEGLTAHRESITIRRPPS